MKKIKKTMFGKMLAVLLAAGLTAGAMPIAAYAEGADEPRGTADYFGNVADEETLYDDEALRAIGFDDTDIEYLKDGKDVVYRIKYDYTKAASYEDATGESKEKLKRYVEQNDMTLYDSFVTEFFATRQRADEDFEIIDGITNVKGMFGVTPDDYGDAESMMEKGVLKMLYLGGDEAVEIGFSPIPDPRGEGNIWFEYDFIDRGDYAFLYQLNDEETDSSAQDSSVPDESTADESIPDSSSAPDSSVSSKTVSDGNSKNPNTGAAAAAGSVIVLALAAVTAAAKKRH